MAADSGSITSWGCFVSSGFPEGATPAEGAYVRNPHDDLLNIVALEAHRAGAYVIGEDLGTVEPEVRGELSGRDVMSYRVWWFEDDDPAQWPARAMGAVTTHDLPTWPGCWGPRTWRSSAGSSLTPTRRPQTRCGPSSWPGSAEPRRLSRR